jgi:hypothetical protein
MRRSGELGFAAVLSSMIGEKAEPNVPPSPSVSFSLRHLEVWTRSG